MTDTISQSEVLAELQRAISAQPPSPDGYTTKEICGLTGWTVDQAREAIRTTIAAGKAKPVKVRRAALDGRNAVCSAYQFVLPPAGRKKR